MQYSLYQVHLQAILYRHGEGLLPFVGKILFRRVLYSTKTKDATPFFNCGFDADNLAQGNNIAADPKHVLEETGVAFLEEQHASLESTAAADVYARCSIETFRKNLEGFKIKEGSPAIGAGKKTAEAVTTGTSDTCGKYPYGPDASTYYSFTNDYTLKVKNACGNDNQPTSKYNLVP